MFNNDGEDKEETKSKTLKTFKPQMNDSVLPVRVVKKKENEYMEHREESNLLGYFSYNGFFDVGISKSIIKEADNEKEGDQTKRDENQDDKKTDETYRKDHHT